MNEITILIADDDPGMRLVMGKLVSRAEGYRLAGEAEARKQRAAGLEQLYVGLLARGSAPGNGGGGRSRCWSA